MLQEDESEQQVTLNDSEKVEELQKMLKDERQLSSSLMKKKLDQITASKMRRKSKIDNYFKEEEKMLQEESESPQKQSHEVKKNQKEVGVQFDYLIPQSGMYAYW